MKKLYLAIQEENSFKIVSEMRDMSIDNLDIHPTELDKYKSVSLALEIESFKSKPVVKVESILAIEVDGFLRKTVWISAGERGPIVLNLEKDVLLGECYKLNLKNLIIKSHMPENLPTLITN